MRKSPAFHFAVAMRDLVGDRVGVNGADFADSAP